MAVHSVQFSTINIHGVPWCINHLCNAINQRYSSFTIWYDHCGTQYDDSIRWYFMYHGTFSIWWYIHSTVSWSVICVTAPFNAVAFCHSLVSHSFSHADYYVAHAHSIAIYVFSYHLYCLSNGTCPTAGRPLEYFLSQICEHGPWFCFPLIKKQELTRHKSSIILVLLASGGPGTVVGTLPSA